MANDREQLEANLRLLSLFHYVVGGVTAVFSLFPLIHLTIGIAIISGAIGDSADGDSPPVFVGWIFVTIAVVLITLGLTVAGLMIAAGRRIAARHAYRFCLFVGGIECIVIPFGTILGIFTLITLNKPEARALFDGAGVD